MASTFFDRVWFSTPTTGNGAVAVGNAVTNYQTPAQAGVPTSTPVTYEISDGSAWEVGHGTVVANTVVRSSLIQSSTGAFLSLSGNASMMLTISAADLSLMNSNTAAAVANIAALQTLTNNNTSGNAGLDGRLTSVERDLVLLDLNRAATTMAPGAVGFADDFQDLSGINTALSNNVTLWTAGDLSNQYNYIATNATQSYSPPTSMPFAPYLVADFSTNTYTFNGTNYANFGALYNAVGMSGTYVAVANGIQCFSGQGIVYPMTVTNSYCAITVNADITSATTGVCGLGQSASIYKDLSLSSGTLSISHTTAYNPYTGEPLPVSANGVSNVNALLWFGSATASRTGGGSINGQYQASASYGTSTTGQTSLCFGRNYTAGGTINNGVVRSFAVYQSSTFGNAPTGQSMSAITQDPFDGSAITPILTGNSNVTGSITASSYQASYPPANVTRYDLDSGGSWPTGWLGTGLATEWLQYQFATPICPSKYRFSVGGAYNTNSMPLGWQFLASNDGVNWTVLDTQGAQTPAISSAPYVRDYFVNTNQRYSYFRLNLTGNTVGSIASGYYYGIGLWMIFDKHAWGAVAQASQQVVSKPATLKSQPSRIYAYLSAKTANGTLNSDLEMGVYRATSSNLTAGVLAPIQTTGNTTVYELRDASDGKPGVNVAVQPAGSNVGYGLITSATYRQDLFGVDVRGV